MAKVGVWLASICAVAVAAGTGGLMHRLWASVWHTVRTTGMLAPPVSAAAVMIPPVPTLAAAVVKKPVPVGPGMFAMPSFVGVAARAVMSGHWSGVGVWGGVWLSERGGSA